MPKDKIGNIKKIGTDRYGQDVYRVQVEAGTRENRLTKKTTVHGTLRDANAAATIIYMQLKGLDSNDDIPELTLDEYFYGVFKPGLAKDGRTAATVSSYENNYAKWISPSHGSRSLTSLTEKEIRSLIESSGTPRNTLRTYRAILNRAKSDGLTRYKIDLTGTKAKSRKREKPAPWSPSELMEALDALKDDELSYLALLLGSAGLRKEESLAMTPQNVLVANRRMAGGGNEKQVLLKVTAAYTDPDGLKGTKTEESANRYALVLPSFTEAFIKALEDTKPTVEPVDSNLCLLTVKRGWKRTKRARYRLETVVGDRDSALKRRDELAKETSSRFKFGSAPQIKEVRGGIWAIRVFDGFDHFFERMSRSELREGSPESVMEEALREWRSSRILDCGSGTLQQHWKTTLKSRGLRYIPVNNLRHTSESLMASSDVSSAAIAKMHGHSKFNTDYEHYIDLNLESIFSVAGKVSEYMDANSGSNDFEIEGF